MASGIYRIKNGENGNLYVGSASSLTRRKNWHFRALASGTHHSAPLQRAYDKYGAQAFTFEVIEYVEPAQLIEREQYYIDTLRPAYNVSPTAGSTLGFKLSPDQVERMRAGLKGKPKTEEHKAKLSEIGRQRVQKPVSPETREKLRAVHLGKKKRPLTPEERQAISERNRGKPGRPLSDETKAKIAAARKGSKASEETKAKMREAHKRK